MKKYLISLFLFLGTSIFYSFFAPTVFSENDRVENTMKYVFDNTNGLPTGEANAVIQTTDGYVWIGSYGGLIRYDGTTFHNYSENNVFPSSSVRSLFEDSKGRLWIGTNDQGLFYYENNSFIKIDNPDKKKFLSVTSLTEGPNGEIYVGTTSGMAVLKENEALLPIEEATHTVYRLARDKNGVIWVCSDNGVNLIRDDELIGSFDYPHLEAAIYGLGVTADGDIILGTTGNQIYRISINDDKYQNSSYQITEYSTDEVTRHNCTVMDSNDNIWVAAHNGLGFIDPDGVWHTMDNEQASAYRDICFDYEGNVWAASNNYGVVHIVDTLFSNPNSLAGISDVFINTIAIDDDGNHYLGTDYGIIILDKDFKPTENGSFKELIEELKNERIRNITKDDSGRIWISTFYRHGVLSYDPKNGTIASFTEKEGLSENRTRLAIQLKNGSMAIATQNGISIIENDKVVKTYTNDDGLNNTVILSLCEGNDGTLYMGSDGQGIYALKDDIITQYDIDDGLPSGVILRMLLEKDGKGMFVSAGDSLYYWDFKEFKLLNNYAKSSGSIFDIMEINDELWLMQSNGINIVNKEQLMSGENASVQVLGSAYGLTGTLNANTWNTENDDILYLSTSRGISILDYSKMDINEEISIIPAVSRITVDNTVYNPNGKIELDSSAKRLTFDFAALSYSGKPVSVRYRLKGFDEEATLLSNNVPMSASYTNLPGGKYEFLIEVMSDNTENPVSKLSITVYKQPKLSELAWFNALIVIASLLLIALMVFIIVRLRIAHLKKRQKEYKSIIDQALQTFANIIDTKDKYTNGHSLRVAIYSRKIAKKLNLSEEDQERIYNIALLHDIGKIGIPGRILRKPGKLTDEEMSLVKKHPSIGGDILKDFTSIPGICEGAKYHHERYDGAGYSEGLKGEDIPYFARIICVADSYDAMTGRIYQAKKETDEIKAEFKRCAGSQFDPKIAEVMIELIDEEKVPVKVEDTNINVFFDE